MPDHAFTACVLQVVPELDTGGVEQTVVDVSEAIIAAGGRSIVVSKGGRLQARLEKGGATVINLPVHSKNPFVQGRMYAALRRIIRVERVDIVHVRSRAPALASIAAARAEKIRSVATYHGIYNAKSALKRWYNSQMTRADLTIANSDYTRDHILAAYPGVAPEKVVSIPRGVDLKRFDPEGFDVRRVMKLEAAWGLPHAGDPGAPETRIRFLLAARLTRWKGQALIVEAAAKLRASGCEDFVILLAGDDQGRSGYSAELKAAIAAHSLEDHVRLVGHCADMPTAYQLCHYALAPSLEPEAFGRTAVEPQAMLRPPLASKHGATVETVVPGETGWLVTPGDADAWAEAMRAAMQLDPEARFAMGLAGRARVKDLFSLEVMCARTLDVYRQLLM
ncbi:MAG: glycosyltransferase family 4 protein [Asticcacaulis sp.]|uniref:glycosyltransferase family 4 protein n=1 Tax=Asticcacaulis sp. TaxID=1872648 RepID=UPI003F7CC621